MNPRKRLGVDVCDIAGAVMGALDSGILAKSRQNNQILVATCNGSTVQSLRVDERYSLIA